MVAAETLHSSGQRSGAKLDWLVSFMLHKRQFSSLSAGISASTSDSEEASEEASSLSGARTTEIGMAAHSPPSFKGNGSEESESDDDEDAYSEEDQNLMQASSDDSLSESEGCLPAPAAHLQAQLRLASRAF